MNLSASAGHTIWKAMTRPSRSAFWVTTPSMRHKPAISWQKPAWRPTRAIALDRERTRRFAGQPYLPHAQIGGLDIAAEQVGIEQRTISGESAFDLLEGGRIAGQPDGHVFVGLCVLRHQLRQS